jgi:hypothetical protein
MPRHDKISEFTIRAREEMAHRANDNAPPDSIKAIQELMRIVLDADGERPEPFEINRPLNATELSAVRTLIDWQADELGVLPRLIALAVEIAFSVEDVVELRAWDFDAVVSYVVYLQGDRTTLPARQLFEGGERS